MSWTGYLDWGWSVLTTKVLCNAEVTDKPTSKPPTARPKEETITLGKWQWISIGLLLSYPRGVESPMRFREYW